MPSYTPSQQMCIESTGRSLMISAGAGTGKTFTLTEKIAWMIRSGEVDSIENVVAITFTEKAASEIKSRVRSTLRRSGMHDQALLVDGAWISTIHSMCARILREHALEVGVDPAFTVVADMEAEWMLQACLEDVVSKPPDVRTAQCLDDLFSEYGVETVKESIRILIEASSLSERGFDSLDFGPEAKSPREIAMMLGDRIRAGLAEVAGSNCELVSFTEQKGKLEFLAEGLFELLQTDFGLDGLCDLLGERMAGLRRMSLKKFPVERDAISKCIGEVAGACADVLASIARGLADELGHVASVVRDRYDEEKRAQGRLSNDDLLVVALKTLRTHPEIAESYRERFSLVMVDEFQDTSQLQIDLIEQIVGPDAQLCTVGDAQQSIYRFRSADVNVYEKFISDSGATPVKLDLNFRSHPDILAFSNSVFEQPHMFGRHYLELKPGKAAKDAGEGPGRLSPRVEMVVVACEASSGVSLSDARRYGAAEIADRFARMRDAGASPGDMVVLLGKSSNAEIYSNALAARGFEVVVAKGSGFWQTPECKLVSDILRMLADPNDSEALFGLMDAGFVPVGVADMVDLSICDTGIRGIGRGFSRIECDAEGPAGTIRRLVDDGRRLLADNGAARVVEWMLSDSGLMDRLSRQGADGSARAANLLKAVRMVEEQERSAGCGIATTSRRFAARIDEGEKDAPGVLMSGGSDAVRIMTIHASKGLEFPIVAMAEFEDPSGPKTAVACETLRGTTYCQVEPRRWKDSYEKIARKGRDYLKSKAGSLDDPASVLANPMSLREFQVALQAFGTKEELAESRRKMYVGITRASEALVMFLPLKGAVSEDSIANDLRAAFFETESFPIESRMFDYGGTEPGRYRRLDLVVDGDGEVMVAGDPDHELLQSPERPVDGEIPPYEARTRLDIRVDGAARARNMFSYSSISEALRDANGIFEMAGEAACGSAGAGVVSDEVKDVGAEAACGSAAASRSGTDHEDETPFSTSIMADEDFATTFGTAFHAVAEYMALTGLIGEGRVSPPDADRVLAIARSTGVSDEAAERLAIAVRTWCDSDLALRASGYARIQPEVPFCMEFPAPEGSDTPLFLNGEIDLLCTDEQRTCALVVDYKTGGSPEETPGMLLRKHSLQAMCYAYAVLTSGIAEVELDFVRVEHVGDDGQPQVVSYSFSASDLDSIHETISQALP